MNTIKQDSAIPLSTSLRASKRTYSLLNSDTSFSKRIKTERLSESSGDLSVLHEESDVYSTDDWMPQSPFEPAQLDAESFDALSNFSEEDMNLFQDVTMPTEPDYQLKAGVCLHVFNKKISLEFCSTCSSMAQESWEAENEAAGNINS